MRLRNALKAVRVRLARYKVDEWFGLQDKGYPSSILCTFSLGLQHLLPQFAAFGPGRPCPSTRSAN